MDAPSVPIRRDLVLVGGGHSHVFVLKGFGMRPIPGVRLTLVCRDVHTPYSGMLPGLIAGHYTYDEAHIDLRKLARFAGARFIEDQVEGLDLEAKEVRFADRPPMGYDVLSINIGSTPGRAEVPGADEYATAVKPISKLVARWEALTARVLEAEGRMRIGVVGAGAAGVEMTLAMQYRWDELLHERGVERRPEYFLFGSAPEPLPTHNRSVQKRFRRVLGERGIEARFGRRVAEVDERGVRLEDGEAVPLDAVLWTTQASTQTWPGEAGLSVDERGFVRVSDSLESVSHGQVFAAGDCAAMIHHPREKAGVFAVRQGPPLERNLRRSLLGEPLEAFAPQKEFLSLVSTGDRYAVGSRSIFTVEGEWVWRWKDKIDRKFMDKFGTDLPEMSAEADDPLAARGESALMRCQGCGSKVAADVLSRVLDKIEPLEREGVVLGLEAPDDAAAISVPEGQVLVQTTDFFPAIVDDPYVFGKIAAQHALSDLYAMGAEPHSALATAVTPFASESKCEQTLYPLLAGANEVLRAAGAALIGGHSSEGRGLALGLTVNGLGFPDELVRKQGAHAGDRLILTKPLGTGVLFAAEMRGEAQGRWVSGAIESMMVSNGPAARVLREHGVRAMTDVTGFGLAGHLLELLGVLSARVDEEMLPLLAGAREMLAAGIASSLDPANRKRAEAIEGLSGIWFDPQTSGGLLAAVPEERSASAVEALRAAGCEHAGVIGEVTADGPRIALAKLAR